tara:strand:- start:1011 stop:1643 length:633 start_codon:yes stop_codon:yes gene_type:complete
MEFDRKPVFFEPLSPKRREGGFTLVEIVISMTVMALLIAASVPSIQGIIREHQAQEPMRELALMARMVRKRAMQQQQPFQVGFDSRGCYASAYFQPYEQGEEYESLRLEELARAAGEKRFGTVEPVEGEKMADPILLGRYEWPEKMSVRLRFWGDTEWEDLSGARFRRWVFQPSGIAKPLVVQFENDGVFIEATFNPLTAEIERERSYVQ